MLICRCMESMSKPDTWTPHPGGGVQGRGAKRGSEHQLSQSISSVPHAATAMGDSHLEGLCHAPLTHADVRDNQRHYKCPKKPMSRLSHLFLSTDSHLYHICLPTGPLPSHQIPLPRTSVGCISWAVWKLGCTCCIWAFVHGGDGEKLLSFSYLPHGCLIWRKSQLIN